MKVIYSDFVAFNFVMNPARRIPAGAQRPSRDCSAVFRWSRAAVAFSLTGITASLLSAGGAQATIVPGNLCWFGTLTDTVPVGTPECATFDPSTGLGTQFQLEDKLVNIGRLDFGVNPPPVGGPREGTLGFQYTPIDPPPGLANDQFSLILNFNPDRNGPYSGQFDYQIFITNPKFQFATAELDSIVSGKPVGSTVTKKIFGFADIVSTDGSNEPEVPVSGSVLTVQNIWNVPAGTVLDSFKDTYTQAPIPEVPGPLPLLGAGAAFGFSRRIRRRILQGGRTI
jgi:hypothetical protein